MSASTSQSDPAQETPEAEPPVDGAALLDLKIQGYVRNLPGVILGNLSAAILILITYWPRVEPMVLLPWFGGIAVLMSIQTHRVFRYRRDPDTFPVRKLPRLLILGAFLTGTLWGALPWIADTPDALQFQLFALFTLALLNTGGAATLAPFYPAYVASLLPCLPSGAIKAVTLDADFAPALGIGLLILSLFLAGIARVMSRAFHGSYRLQLVQAGLLQRMRAQAVALTQSAEEATLANRAKSDFLATISHEIRTPVNAMLGGIDILRATPLDDRQQDCVRMLEKAGQSMLTLVDDILDITRIEAGHLALETQDFDLHRRLTDVVELMMPRAVAKGLAIGLDIGSGVPRHVRGDPARLRQILLNLVGNAVKFTDRGAITVTATALEGGPPGKPDGLPLSVRFTVADTGIGIAPDRLTDIFEPFSQADGSIARRFGGVGLGLTICRRLALLMGGTIGVESTPGKGSRFHVDLPLPVAEAAGEMAPPTPALPSWRRRPSLLLVEDEPINRTIAEQLLVRHGFQVHTADSGEDALALLRTRPVDAVLMDLSMPGMDGFATAAAIRALPPPLDAMPVVALTASVMPETVARCAQAGMRGFVAKPIRMEVLLRSLADLIPPDGEVAADTALGKEVLQLEAFRRGLGDAAADAILAEAAIAVEEARLQLTRAWARRSRRRLADVAHRLAGTLDIVGLSDSATTLRILEDAAGRVAIEELGPQVDAALGTLAVAADLMRTARMPEPVA